MSSAQAVSGPQAHTRPNRRVCLVTTEFHGLFRNGGIGTANTGLALTLASAGLDVTVAFANADENGPRVATGDFTELKSHYRTRGITLDYVPQHPRVPNAFDDPRTASYAIFLYLQDAGFDIVLFNDNGGQGYYTLLAKHTGVFVDPPEVIVVTHGPISWVHDLNAQRYPNRDTIAATFMERRCAALADTLISPSRYLLDWMTSQGWTLPDNARVIQNIINTAPPAGIAFPDGRLATVSDIVFFGRLELRKGLELFCDALERLGLACDLSKLTVTFLGKFAHIRGLHSGIYLAERTRHWHAQVRIITVYDQAEALEHIGRPGTLAIIPSLAENSPSVVLECLQLGVPFLATDSGGTAELIAQDDRAACLVPPDPAVLASRIEQVLRDGHGVAHAAITPEQTVETWFRLLDQAPRRGARQTPGLDNTASSALVREPPLVSVCLVLDMASQCPILDSIWQQTYQRVEVIIMHEPGKAGLITDDSTWPFPTHVVQTTAATRGAARNQATSHAAGHYLLFADEATVALLPDCIATLVTAAGCGADTLTGLSTSPVRADGRHGNTTPLPLGACLQLGVAENCFGGGIVFVTTSAYRQGPRFDPACNDEVLDWLFLTTSVLRGYRHEVVPQPLFHSRTADRPRIASVRATETHRQILHAYRDVPIAAIAPILELLPWMERETEATLVRNLVNTSPGLLDIARRLNVLDPGSAAANRAFLEYCCERRLVKLALEFALLNNISLLPETIRLISRAADANALEAIRRQLVDVRHDLDLTSEARIRARPIAPMQPADLMPTQQAAAIVRLGIDVAIVKVAGVCPPGTSRIFATVHLDPCPHPGIEVAIAMCRRGVQILLPDRSEPDADLIWSGWQPGANDSGTDVVVTAAIPEPTDDLLDLYLMARRTADGPCPEVSIVWAKVAAEIAIVGPVTASAIEAESILVPVPAGVISQGVLLTDTSAFPLRVYIPGDPTLLHPIPGQIALVRLTDALPAGSSGLTAAISVGHVQAHAIDFGVWIRPSGTEPPDEAERDGFSGWLTVNRPLVRHRLSAMLPAPAKDTMDVYLATRVTGSTNVDYCHALWHGFWFIEASRL